LAAGANPVAVSGKFGYKLRTFILNANAALAEHLAAHDITRDDPAGGGKEFSSFELDALVDQIVFRIRMEQTD
jgi:hypothetical protein